MSEHDPSEDKIDLSNDICPNREQRANGTNVFFRKASELLNDAKEGTLSCSEKKFQQSGGCILNFYLSVSLSPLAYFLEGKA